MEKRSHPSRGASPWTRLRAEHERMLRRVERLERMKVSADGRMPAASLRLLRAFAAQLAGAFETHMAAEESGPYATLAGPFPELREPLARLQADHETLREMRRDLAELLAAPGDARRDERLLVLAGDLAELLRLHFRAEERLAFDWRTRLEPTRAPAELRPPSAPKPGRANR